MPQILMSNAKGVVQSSGAGLVLEAAEVINMDGDDSLDMTHPYHRLTAAGGANRTLTLPDASSADLTAGQMLLLSNTGAANDVILSGAGNAPLSPGESVMLVWVGDAWQLTSQTLS
jgi:hypothetical protein